ncbi:unnamed protein product [Aspergillus oryzae]|nr:unnamed protein product [Aspergillus oryzae]GMF86404.1 unnamed protein product [Aspergillus oryzae]GMG40933.1 unnamed protein product [Aspergillus oryzae var. brunneus]
MYKVDFYIMELYPLKVYIGGNILSKLWHSAIGFHAGGFTIGSRFLFNSNEIDALLDFGFVVISADHRLCPHVSLYDGPIEDAKDAFNWARTTLPDLIKKDVNIDIDGDRIVAFGQSSGGTLALHLGSLPNPPRAIAAFYAAAYFSDEIWTQPTPGADMMPPIDKAFAESVYDEAPASMTIVAPQQFIAPGTMPMPNLSVPRDAWMALAFKEGQHLSRCVKDGDFGRVDPATYFSPKFPPTVFLTGTDDTFINPKFSKQAHAQLSGLKVETKLVLAEAGQHGYNFGMEKDDVRFQETVLPGYEFLADHRAPNFDVGDHVSAEPPKVPSGQVAPDGMNYERLYAAECSGPAQYPAPHGFTLPPSPERYSPHGEAEAMVTMNVTLAPDLSADHLIDFESWFSVPADNDCWPDLTCYDQDFSVLDIVGPSVTEGSMQKSWDTQKRNASLPQPNITEVYRRNQVPEIDKDAVEPRHYDPARAEDDAQLIFPDMTVIPREDIEAENLAHVEEVSAEVTSIVFELANDMQLKSNYPQFIELRIPPAPVLNAWVQLYFEHFHPMFPVLHKPTFSTSGSNPFLVLAVAAIGAHFSDIQGAQPCLRAMHELIRRYTSYTVRVTVPSRSSDDTDRRWKV